MTQNGSLATCDLSLSITQSGEVVISTVVSIFCSLAGVLANLLLILVLIKVKTIDIIVQAILIQTATLNVLARGDNIMRLANELVNRYNSNEECGWQMTWSTCVSGSAVVMFLSYAFMGTVFTTCLERAVSTYTMREQLKNYKHVTTIHSKTVIFMILTSPLVVCLFILAVFVFHDQLLIEQPDLLMPYCNATRGSIGYSQYMYLLILFTFLIGSPILILVTRRMTKQMNARFLHHGVQQTLHTRVTLKRNAVVTKLMTHTCLAIVIGYAVLILGSSVLYAVCAGELNRIVYGRIIATVCANVTACAFPYLCVKRYPALEHRFCWNSNQVVPMTTTTVRYDVKNDNVTAKLDTTHDAQMYFKDLKDMWTKTD